MDVKSASRLRENLHGSEVGTVMLVVLKKGGNLVNRLSLSPEILCWFGSGCCGSIAAADNAGKEATQDQAKKCITVRVTSRPPLYPLCPVDSHPLAKLSARRGRHPQGYF